MRFKKLFLLLLAALLVVPVSFGALTDGLKCYYNFSNTLNDSVGSFDFVEVGTLVYSANASRCINPPCLYLNGGADNTMTSAGDHLGSGAVGSMNFWGYWVGNGDPSGSDYGTMWDMKRDSSNGWINYNFVNEKVFEIRYWAQTKRLRAGSYEVNKRKMVTVTWNASGMSIYLNGSLANFTSDNTFNLHQATATTWGHLSAGDRGVNIYLDEFSVWNKCLSASDVVLLWNGAAGVFPPFRDEPVLSWQGYTPLNNSVMTSLDPIFFNHTNINPLNCSLWKNITTIIEYNESIGGVAGFWRFEEGSGSLVIDSSIYGDNGTITGAAYNSSKGGNLTGGYALVFDGVADVVSIPDAPQLNLNESYTVSAWIKPLSVDGLNTIVSKAESVWELNTIVYAGSLMAGFENCADDNFFGSGGVIIKDKWQHIAHIYNGTKVIGYIDGVKVFEVDGSGVPCLSGYALGVGSSLQGLRYYFNGSIDEVIIFNRSLSSGEVLDLYNAGLIITHQNISSSFISIQNLSGVLGDIKQNFSEYSLSNGAYELFVGCDGLNSSVKFVDVNGTLPIINFLNIQNFFISVPLVQGGVYEFAEGVWNLSVNVTLSDHYNFSFYNRTALESEVFDTGIINLQSSVFNSFVEKNPFNVSVSAYNSFGSSYNSLAFQVNDSVLPLCSGSLSDVHIVNSDFFVWNVSCVDELFFSFNMSCSNNYSFYEQDILSTEYFFNESIGLTSDVVCVYEFCDGHTKSKIEDFFIKKDLENKTFIVEGKKLVLSHSVKNITWEKKADRYEFCFDFESTAKLNQVDILIPAGCHYVSSQWQGHLVCPADRMWFDFESEDVKATITKDRVLLDLSQVKGNKVCFNSVGKFNCVTGSQKLFFDTVVPEPIAKPFTSVPQALFYVFLLCFWAVFFILTFLVTGRHGDTVQILNLFQMVLGVTAGVVFIPFSFAVGFAVIFVAVGTFVGMAVYGSVRGK